MDKKNLDLLSTQTLYCKTKHIKNRGGILFGDKNFKMGRTLYNFKSCQMFSLLLPFLFQSTAAFSVAKFFP